MKSKLSIIVVLLALAGSYTACTEEEVAPQKENVENVEATEFDGIPESDAHTEPEQNIMATKN